MTSNDPAQAARRGRGRMLRRAMRAAAVLALLGTALATGLALLVGMSPRTIALPVWVLAEAEARLTRAVRDRGGAALTVSVGAIAADVDGTTPRLILRDLTLAAPDGKARLRLPEAAARFDRAALARGQLRLSALTVPGARLRLVRDADGSFDIAFGDGAAALNAPEAAAALLRLFEAPELAGEVRLAITGASVLFEDRRAGRSWTMTDGAATLTRAPAAAGGGLALDIALAVGPAAARLEGRLLPDGAVRIAAAVAGVPAADIASQAPPLGWLAPVDAPLSGQIAAAFDPGFAVTALEGRLDAGTGAIRPEGAAAPVPFDRAEIAFALDPAAGRLALSRVAVEAPALRLSATGAVTIEGGGVFRAEVDLGPGVFDPAGTFAEPLRFDGGRLTAALAPQPFRFALEALALRAEGRALTAAGQAAAGAEGWTVALDAGIDRIPADRLLMLWPLALLPGTRAWLETNVREGTLTDLRAALRAAPGAPPDLALDYRYEGASVRVLPGLPPLTGLAGTARLAGNAYALAVTAGRVEPPAGGALDLSGSVFRVPDTMQVPGVAEVRIEAAGSVTAMLSLLDQPPFGYAAAAGVAPDALAGTGRVSADLTLPLAPVLGPGDVRIAARGTLADVESTRLIPGRRLAADRLAVTVDGAGVSVGGAVAIDGVPAEATWRQTFGPGAAAGVTGRLALGPAFARAFLAGLPDGAVTGAGRADFALALPRGAPPRLTLSGDLAGLRLRLPALGWDKPSAAGGRIAAALTLGPAPVLDRLALEAPGLAAEGAGALRPDGGIARLDFARVRAGRWLDAAVRLDGDGTVTLSDGRVDLRALPQAADVGAAPPLVLAGMTLTATDRIALTGAAGRIESRASRSGRIEARVNRAAPVSLQIEGDRVRIRAEDAGGALAAAGLFERGRGGTLDLVLGPDRGGLAGMIEIGRIRVVGMPVLAELLSAASIVGLIDQLSGTGLVFNRVSAGLRLDGPVLRVLDGVAEGPSFGVTLRGVYDTAADRLDMDGVLSPLYILNGIGQVLTRPGEGMFGFTYRLTGPAARPALAVNPMSVFAPGFLREMFRNDSGETSRFAPPPPAVGDR